MLRRRYHALLAHPRVYDRAQRYGGGVPIAHQVAQVLADTANQTVLDLGGGTGMVGDILPPGATYIWLDNDPLKLGGFRRKQTDALAVLADAARLPLADRSVDVATMVEVAHHLPDGAFESVLSEAARVVKSRFVLVDGLRTQRLRSRALWALDLGRFPRTRDALEQALATRFDVRNVVEFRVNHDHVIFDAAARAAHPTTMPAGLNP
jgi:SAM-dependent methyltransferase